MINLKRKKEKNSMKKILIVIFVSLFSLNLFASEKECKEKYGKWVERMKYGKLKNSGKKISEKYKDLRNKVPKTGVEIWKKFKKE